MSVKSLRDSVVALGVNCVLSCRHFVSSIDVTGLAVDVAVRKFQSHFWLPVSDHPVTTIMMMMTIMSSSSIYVF